MTRIVVTGAGGFIGHHLVKSLKENPDNYVIGIDIKFPEFEDTKADEFYTIDLRRRQEVWDFFFFSREEIDNVYALAADMGGMGFISKNHADIFSNNIRINLNTIDSTMHSFVKKYFFTSSACVYNEDFQRQTDVKPLSEDMAYPADPGHDSYGWEKLMGERICMWNTEQYGIETRIVRFHNIYGPLGTWEGGREKVPAALCRKIAYAKLNGNPEIEIWGDGEQTRSFCYIDDCVVGIQKLMESDYSEPLNLGTDDIISINDLAFMIAKIAGIEVKLKHIPGPQGVRGRNSDNTKLKEVLNWEPSTDLVTGLTKTYNWIEEQVLERWNLNSIVKDLDLDAKE